MKKYIMINNGLSALFTINNYHKQGRTVVFDLDNTIYPEIKYLDQAYKKFAGKIEDIFGVDSQLVYSYMMNRLSENARSSILQDTCKNFDLQLDSVREILFYYLRQSKPLEKIDLYDWAEKFFISVDNISNCAIITNGNFLQQSNKIQNVEVLDRLSIKQIIYADLYLPKPAVDSARHLESIMDCNAPVYIGDSESDFLFAKAAGWDFCQINNS